MEEREEILNPELKESLNIYKNVNETNLKATRPKIDLAEGLNGVENKDIQETCLNYVAARQFMLFNWNIFTSGKPYDILTDLEIRAKEVMQLNSEDYQERQKEHTKAIEREMKKDLRDPNLKDDLKEQIKLKYKTLSKTVDFDKVKEHDPYADLKNTESSFSLSRALLKRYKE